MIRALLMSALIAFLSACGAKQVVVEGNFPTPVLDPIPLTLGIVYPEEFLNHEIYDEAAGRTESDWLVKTGAAQVEFWDILFGAMFENVVHIRSHDDIHRYEGEVDGVIVPYVNDLQYTIPLYTNIKVYEIWMKYQFRLVTLDDIHDHANGDLTYHPEQNLAEWQLTAYGKTPTAFLQSDEAAVNLAAVVALRDAGANFATSFRRVPGVKAWLELDRTALDDEPKTPWVKTEKRPGRLP